jgi:hypothetical protein
LIAANASRGLIRNHAKVGLHDLSYQLGEPGGTPLTKFLMRLALVAQELVDFGGAEIARIDAHEILPV